MFTVDLSSCAELKEDVAGHEGELLGRRFSDELELSDPEAIELSDSESIGTSRSSMVKDRFKRIAKQSLNEV